MLQQIPLFVANYVVGDYGSGAVMGVPCHDDRDWKFAKAHDLPRRPVIMAADSDVTDNEADTCFTNLGILINSGPYSGLNSTQAKQAMIADGTKNGVRVLFVHVCAVG